MKKLLAVATFAAVLALVPAISQAQETPAPAAPSGTPGHSTDAETQTLAPNEIFIATPGADDYLARDELIGAKVHNKETKIIGDIEDLILDENDQVTGVIMGVGGFLGAGEKKLGIKIEALEFSEKDGKSYIILPQASKELFAATEPFKRTVERKSLIERAKEKAIELKDKSTDTAKDAMEKAKPALDSAKQQAGEAYEKAKEAAKGAVDKAKEAMTPADPPAVTPAPVPAPTPAPVPAPTP